jgi:hypothetical protein
LTEREEKEKVVEVKNDALHERRGEDKKLCLRFVDVPLHFNLVRLQKKKKEKVTNPCFSLTFDREREREEDG